MMPLASSTPQWKNRKLGNLTKSQEMAVFHAKAATSRCGFKPVHHREKGIDQLTPHKV
jgi:hypothetical protein